MKILPQYVPSLRFVPDEDDCDPFAPVDWERIGSELIDDDRYCSLQQIYPSRRCMVCEFPYAEAHHPIPRSVIKPCKKIGLNTETILLCPNHHRMADMIQELAAMGATANDFPILSRHLFDPLFNYYVLDDLVNTALLVAEVKQRQGAT